MTYSYWSFPIICAIFFIIILTTIIGNVLVFAALFRFKRLQTTSNFLIGNLALSDLLLAISVLPFSAATDATDVWLFGSVLCHIWLTIDVFYCTASVWSLVAIAFDRFTATTFPIWYRTDQNKIRVLLYMLFVWILSGLICLPGLLGWGSKTLELHASKYDTFDSPNSHNNKVQQLIESPNNTINYEFVPHSSETFLKSTNSPNTHTNHYECVLFTESHYVVYSAMGSFILPLIVMIGLYAKIFVILQKRSHMLRKCRKPRKRNYAVKNDNDDNDKNREVNDFECEPLTGKELMMMMSTPQQISTQHCSTKPNISELISSNLNDSSNNDNYSNIIYNTTIDDDKISSEETNVIRKKDLNLSKINKHNCCVENNQNNDSTESITSPNYVMQLKIANTTSCITVSNSKICHNQSTIIRTAHTISDNSTTTTTTTTTSTTNNNNHRINHNNSIQRKNISLSKHPFKLFLKTKSTKPQNKNIPKNMIDKAEQREHRATKRMALIIFIFVLCWIPFTLMYLIRGLCGDQACPVTEDFRKCVTWLGYTNSMINPILYALFNREFRQAFSSILKCTTFHQPT